MHLAGQDLQKCKAIVDCTMTLMKVAGLANEIAELGALIISSCSSIASKCPQSHVALDSLGQRHDA
jgi:hypothetical protein